MAQFNDMEQILVQNGISTLNLWQGMAQTVNRENFEHYSWWRYDGHYKHTGYLLMAEIIATSPQVQQLFNTSEADSGELLPDSGPELLHGL